MVDLIDTMHNCWTKDSGHWATAVEAKLTKVARIRLSRSRRPQEAEGGLLICVVA